MGETVFWILGAITVVIFFSLSGCVGVRHQTGFQKTTNEPLHAESGTGITVWKIPILGIGNWGDFWGQSQVPSVIVHRYDYTAQPRALAPGAPPLPPSSTGPPPVDYQTIAHGTWELVRFFKIYIQPEGRSQIFHIYNY
jgi:hypothetical protein